MDNEQYYEEGDYNDGYYAEGQQEQEVDYSAVGYYDENGQWFEYPKEEGPLVDEQGRLLKGPIVDESVTPEDINVFKSGWQKQRTASRRDAGMASLCVWPECMRVVDLKRFDLFECLLPLCQQGTTNLEDSRRIRHLDNWFPVRSLYFMDCPGKFTKEVTVETAGPPKRDRFLLQGKMNPRDLSTWVMKETLIAYMGSDKIPGTKDFFIDFQDTPDRYFISSDFAPVLGRRRLFRFAAYPATQYFIIETRVHHEDLMGDGGSGVSQLILKGPILFARKNWKIIGSFFGFDEPLLGSNQYTIYTRNDPFPRMMIAIGRITRSEEWNSELTFYAFDVPVPGTVMYALQHSIRSIYSTASNVQRHRLTTEDARHPWELLQNIYVFPAGLEDCRITDIPPE